MSLFIATAAAAILISSWQVDGLFHLIFFDGFSGWLFWFVLLPCFTGFFCRLAWQWQHGKSIAALILAALLPSLLLYWQRHSYLDAFDVISSGIRSGIAYPVAPLVIYILLIPFLTQLELSDDEWLG